MKPTIKDASGVRKSVQELLAQAQDVIRVETRLTDAGYVVVIAVKKGSAARIRQLIPAIVRSVPVLVRVG